MPDEHGDELPPDIITLPAELFRGEWLFRLATSVRPDGSGGGFQGGFPEAAYREALAEQGYDPTAISLAVVEAVAAGKLAPPEPDDDLKDIHW